MKLRSIVVESFFRGIENIWKKQQLQNNNKFQTFWTVRDTLKVKQWSCDQNDLVIKMILVKIEVIKIKIVYANIIKVLVNISKQGSVEKLQINLPASELRALAPSVRVVPNKSVLSGNFWK